ncbi:hypothetical protein T484DRAFT_1869963 [Baffinella frigidus]|nr:hypothetical protein T484DRAFT_1869963 [Cryptophyta sp. CCMP2293]
MDTQGGLRLLAPALILAVPPGVLAGVDGDGLGALGVSILGGKIGKKHALREYRDLEEKDLDTLHQRINSEMCNSEMYDRTASALQRLWS